MSTTTAAKFAANTSDRRQERNTGIQNPKRDRGFESGVLEVIRGGLGVLAHPSGTDGSNPVPSSGESGANRDRGDQRSPSTRGPASCRQHYGRRPEAEPELEFHLPPVPARFLDHNAQLLAIPKTVVSA